MSHSPDRIAIARDGAGRLSTVIVLGALLVIGVAVACAAPPSATNPSTTARRPIPVGIDPAAPRNADIETHVDSASLMREIQAEIGDAACESDSECRSIAVGAKACGGSEAFLAWSIAVAREDILTGLVQRHERARRAEITPGPMVSNCGMKPDPGAVCRPRADHGKRTCQAGPGTRGNPGPTQ
jgi:hypothetical protein